MLKTFLCNNWREFFLASVSMRTFLLHIVFLFCLLSIHAQDYTALAKDVRSLEEAQKLADSLGPVNVGFMHAELENPEYLARMNELQPGDSYLTGFYRVVVVSEGSKDLYRFRLLSLTEKNTPGASQKAKELFRDLINGRPFEELHQEYAENKTDGENSVGDVGWVDPDFFIESFKKDLVGHRKGEQFLSSDPALGWYNIVEMTHEPKEMQGHYVLFFPEEQQQVFDPSVNHEKNFRKLKSLQEFKGYVQSYPGDVSLQIMNKAGNADLFESMVSEKENVKKNEPTTIDADGIRYRWLKDTTVELFSIQYVYLDGSKMTSESKNEAIHDIYDQYHANVPFDSIVSHYWPDHNGLSVMRNIEATLLAEDLVTKVRATEVGQLFVARVGQSYFLGVPLEEPKKVEAFLVIAYPKPMEE